MITLLDKQKIILKHHHDRKSQRAIHRETGISRKTIRKYIKEYESKKAALFDSRNIPDGELIQSIVEKPTYDSSSRKKTKLTPQIIERIADIKSFLYQGFIDINFLFLLFSSAYKYRQKNGGEERFPK